jgi:hypothetical protein
MESALIGLLGVIVGLLITEYFHRKRRIEAYSSEIFAKQLKIYEGLNSRLTDCAERAGDIIENPEYSEQERQELWSSVVLDLADYIDANSLYIDEDIAIHCMTTVIGVDDIFSIQDEDQKRAEIRDFYQELRNAREMMREETGLSAASKLFRSITQAKHQSPYISHAHEVRKRLETEKRGDT